MANTSIILIVDDDPISRSILTEMFKDDYTVVETENVFQAIDILSGPKKIEPAALLLDYDLPEMDALTLLQTLTRCRLLINVPAFLLTAESSNEVVLEAFSAGFEDVILKPITVPIIVKKHVQNIIRLYQIKTNLEKLISEQVDIIHGQSRKLIDSHIAIIDVLCTTIEFRSGESGAHVNRVRGITKFLLEFMSNHSADAFYTDSEIELISNAAAMHDIGKLSVPDAILNKQGRFSAEEFEIMKKHTVYGCDILNRITFLGDKDLYKYSYEICRHHHERYDGNGYPDGLIGRDIPLYTQIVSIADTYDALISERIYKKALPHEQAKRMILNGECGVFGDEVLSCFKDVADELYLTIYSGSV